jgi:four helix bundle protein
MNRKNLEDRLIDFAVLITEIVNEMPNTRASNHYAGQLLRSGSSPALNYGETQSAESKKDFIHKMSIVLKELRESLICLTNIKRTNSFGTELPVSDALNECNELVAIFVKSLQTARKNKK